MYFRYVSAAVLFLIGIALYADHVSADEANVAIVTSGYCSKDVLRKKGVDPEKYKPKVRFDPKLIRIEPQRPKLPGCFRLIARNVTITSKITQMTAEFGMRLASNGNDKSPPMQCKKRQPKCGCGEKDNCVYCDFCKNIKQELKDGKINNKAINAINQPDTCDCNVPADTYSIDVTLCTPDNIENDVPTEVVEKVTDGDSFSLFTHVYMYDFRWQSLTDASENSAAGKALKARKAKGLCGCFIIGTNIKVE